MLKKASLTTRISFIFMIVVLLQGILVATVTWTPYETSIKKHIFTENQEIANKISDNISRIFIEKFNILKIITENSDIKSTNPTRQAEVLSSITRNMDEVQLAILADTKGNQIARWDTKPADKSIQYWDRPYYNQVINTGKIVVTDVIRARSTGLLGIVVAAPVKNDSGKVIAVLTINLELGKLIEKIKATKVGVSGYAYVVNENKQIIIDPKNGLLEHPIAASGIIPVEQVYNKKSGSIEYTTRTNQHVLASYSPVDTIRWGVIVEQPYSEALKELNVIRDKEIYVVIILVVIIAIIGILLALSIVRPIKRIITASKAMSEGDLSIRLNGSWSGELDQLSKSFNQMADFVSMHQEELESMVEERTRELSLVNEELNRIATIDGLTGLANRRYLDEFLQREWDRAMRESTPLTVMMIDVDFFKRYNDTYGHLAGDEALKKTAIVLQRTLLHSTDIAARYGGEEFMIVLPGTDSTGAATVADRLFGLMHEMNIPHPESGIADRITLSAGVTTIIPAKGMSLDLFVESADQAVYLAKQQGRNRIVIL